MMGRMEAGEGRGGLSEESSPFLPKLPARFVSLPPSSKSFGCWGGYAAEVPLDGDGARCGRFFTVKKADP